MNPKMQFLITCLWLLVYSATAADKWSRQLEATGPGSETYDWVPVAQPIDAKDRAGRVITYQQNFPPNAAFGELQKHHHAPPPQQVQPFGFPFHFQRFPQPQTQPLNPQPLHSQQQLHHQNIQQQKLNPQSQQPTSQSFFKFEMPFNRDGNRNQENSQGVQTGYQIQHSSFGGPQSLFHSPLFSQKQVFPPEFHPVQRPQSLLQQQPKPIQQNFIDEPTKQILRESNPISTQNSFVSTPAPSPAFPIQQQAFEVQKPTTFQSQPSFQAPLPSAPDPSANTQQDDEVQLLYVPYDTLYNQQRNENPSFDSSKYNIGPNVQQVNPYQINNFYTPETLQPIDPNHYTTSTTLRPTTTTLRPTTPFQNFFSQQFTTPKPKPKAHQPPLAMFVLKSSARPSQTDVVNALRNAKTIAVLDAPTSQAPAIFVGPAGMQTPIGYAKFELPYLSQIAQNSNLIDTYFFVAPLSYRTPSGFNKILLPEPHVGSIVVNRQRETYNAVGATNEPTLPQIETYNNIRGSNNPPPPPTQQRETYNNIRGSHQPEQPLQRDTFTNIRGSNQASPNQNVFITPSQNEIQQFPSTTPRNHPETTQRIKSTTPREYFPEIVRNVPKLERGRFPYEITTQRQPPTPSRGHKYSEISTQKNYFPEAIQEVTSPKIYKQERVKPNYQQKRPESQYAHFKPIPHNVDAEDFYKVQPIRTSPPTTSTSTSTTTTSTTSTVPPRTYFTQTYPTSPQIDFQSTRGQVYHGPEVSGNRFTTRPPIQQQQVEPQQVADEEYRMKQYFRQQDAFRNRPSFPTTTASPTIDTVPYTPVSVDYDREVRIPSSTPTYFTTTSSRPATQRQRVTFYHPTQTTPMYEENSNTVPPSEQVFEFSRDRDTQTTPSQQEVLIGQSERTTVPENHRPTFANSNVYDNNNNNEISTQDTAEVEFDPNPYQLPSELPPLTPNLPGLVNGLIEKDKLNGAVGETTVQFETSTASSLPTRPTRRPINRIKKPVVSKVSQSVSYSSSDYSTRRPINRIRRPYSGRNYTTSSPLTTERPSTSSRSPIIRNPNRIRYNPTPEERQSLRIKNRKHGSGGKKNDKSDDLEYQRDVLKQNYPVFKPSTKRTTTAAPPTTDRPVSESQQIYTVTPSSSQDQSFDGIVEPMEIAQQYQEYPQSNYGPGYFPNEEEIIPTETVLRNEINPIYSTSSTTEEPQVTTRRTPFIRRGPRIRTTTTTESPITSAASTLAANEERYTVRTRAPPRRILKVRARTRRPHPASSTTTSTPENVDESEPEKNNFHRLNRFNQDLYQDEMAQRRQRIKSQFHLEPQESQWSPSLSGKSVNNFQPLTNKDELPATKKFENEPEIVTANPEAEKSDSYLFNVSAGFGPTANTHFASKVSEDKSIDNSKKSEKSFADLLEEVMSDIGKESDNKSAHGSYFESQKTDTRLNRRGKWKNTNGNAGESFETAESQNIGAQFFNSLYTGTIDKATESISPLENEFATVAATKEEPMLTTTSAPMLETELVTDTITVIPSLHLDSTTKSSLEPLPTSSIANIPLDSQPESITRRVDELWNVEDLDTQPSDFSEVRKQLNELFAVEENDNEADQSMAEFIQPHKYEYTNIQRVRTTPESIAADASTESEPGQSENANMFHKNLMESVVYATSTSTKEDASETEICYRGRCIRSEDLPANHKLH